MDKELAQYYEERFSMMSTIGWKQLIEDVQGLKDNYENLSNIKTVDELYFKKGQIDILIWLLNLKEISEQAFEGLQSEETV
jgi:hypothetical protein